VGESKGASPTGVCRGVAAVSLSVSPWTTQEVGPRARVALSIPKGCLRCGHSCLIFGFPLSWFRRVDGGDGGWGDGKPA